MNEPNQLPKDHPVNIIAEQVGGKIEHVSGPLPDGSGFATMSIPLPKDHWLYAEGFNVPPMGLRCGTAMAFGDRLGRQDLRQRIQEAAKYAIRASTMNGKEPDFDPDAMVQNFVTGLLGYCTPDGLSSDDWANPEHLRKGDPTPPAK